MAALVGPLGFGVSPIPRVSQAPEPASGGNRTEASGRRRGGVGARSAPWFPRTACEEDLIEAALGEVRRGETWVKLVADFPDIRDPGAPEPTYPVALIGRMAEAVHMLGDRVAAHSTLPNAGELHRAGVDSIEHGPGLDEDAVRLMARTGVDLAELRRPAAVMVRGTRVR